MNQTTIASIRTITPQAWAALIVVVARTVFGWELESNWALFLVPLIGAFFYRISRVIEGKWPVLGWVLLGYGSEPVYPKPTT